LSGDIATGPPTEGVSVDLLDPTTDPSWEEFVEAQPMAGIFHHPAWIRLLKEQYGFKTYAVCLRRGRTLLAGIPLCEVRNLTGRPALVGLPFTDHCAPLAQADEYVRPVVEHIREEASKSGMAVQIRSPVGAFGFIMGASHLLHVLNIDRPAQDMLKAFKPRVHRPIKKAAKEGVITEFRYDLDSVRIFWELHLKTRRRQGVPIQPRRYFGLFHESIIARGLGFVGLSMSDGKYISAAVFCAYKDVVTYKYGASDPQFAHLSPMYPLLWQAILYAKGKGFSTFDFGRTARSNAGLSQFKSGWNATESDLAYSYFPEVPSSRMFSLTNSWLVQPVIRHTPSIVCRVAGQVLYKYFGG
jgi:hypothetical protein